VEARQGQRQTLTPVVMVHGWTGSETGEVFGVVPTLHGNEVSGSGGMLMVGMVTGGMVTGGTVTFGTSDVGLCEVP
jgi:hypothetical protein